MTAPFATGLRVERVVTLDGADSTALHVKVQAAELWDAIRVDAHGSAAVADVKSAALEEFYPDGVAGDDYVVKLRGFEVLDERASLSDVGVRDGSTLLVTRRRRRPVR